MTDLFEPLDDTRLGLRLHKLEVYNWGTFDSVSQATRGRIHTIRPEGQTALLVGQNGSGKSTLVDALLTLLVRPAVRNYNVAAGGGKRERDERSYIKGAYGRFSRDDDNKADVQFLRPDSRHYSVILASFSNPAARRVLTVAQVLYLDAEGHSRKVYCLAPDERSIAADCAGLTSMEKLKQQMQKRGFRATTTYSEFHEWFRKSTGVRPKAMDMFNQTVAVKDIQRLNDFIRRHMLESRPWNEKIGSLLRHFSELGDAHQSLVRIRRQFDLLEPISRAGAEYREHAGQLDRSERIQSAADSFFRRMVVELFTPQCAQRREELARLHAKQNELTRDMATVRKECARLENEIEHAGGERLREIPLLIERHEIQVSTKRVENRRYHENLKNAGVHDHVGDQEAFTLLRERVPGLREEVNRHIEADTTRRDELVVERGEVAHRLRDDERELAALKGRRTNLPESFADVRRRLCEELRMPERTLPFVAELVAVKSSARPWETTAEMILRSFALSLLVPESHYVLVSRYVERTSLRDARDRGQRLVYLRVGARALEPSATMAHDDSLLQKLELREGHALVPWVKAELQTRFDYRCCETLEEFQGAHGLAATRERHVKIRGVRHEKDDRARAVDPRHFVLGWDNREKRRRIAEEIARLRESLDRLERAITGLEDRLTGLRDRQSALQRLDDVSDFVSIDFAMHEAEITALELERKAIEDDNAAIRVLKERLGTQRSREATLQTTYDQVVRQAGVVERELEEGVRLIAASERVLRQREADGNLQRHEETYAEIADTFADRPLTAGSLFESETGFKEEVRLRVERLRQETEPLRSELTRIMNRFLREFPDEQSDLDADVRYLDSFLGLLEHIRNDDLPRHEQRFKERLNEKVTHEVGLLNAALQTERSEIEDRVGDLNESLRQLEYRPGTHMRLEARPVRDREIAAFRRLLAECLSGTFEGTAEADEARYVQIAGLVKRLREEENWRNRVTDVRRWFDFVARELDDATGEERGYYEDSTGQSGGEKAKLAFTILVAAIAYQYDIDPNRPSQDRFQFVVVDEMFSKIDDQYSDYALQLFEKFGLQLLIVAPLDAKARVTEPYVGCYLHVVKDDRSNVSEVLTMTARAFDDEVAADTEPPTDADRSRSFVRGEGSTAAADELLPGVQAGGVSSPPQSPAPIE